MGSSRDAFLSACASITATLTPCGYKYAKSGPHASRTNGEFTYRISFQSSRGNVAGAYVALWIHATVFSRRLQKWRASQPIALYTGNFVAGGQIGNLLKEHTWRNWNVSDPVARKVAIDDAAAALRDIALPYFSRFDDIPSFCDVIQREDVPSMEIGRAIDFLMCYADRDAATNAMRRFLTARPNLQPLYSETLSEIRHKGPTGANSGGFVHKLALATFAYGLAPPASA